MSYDVLVQSPAEGEYRATVLGWPNLVVTGQSERSVLEKVKNALRIQLAQSKIIHLSDAEVEANSSQVEHPWQQFLGMWQNDATFDDFVAHMDAFRKSQEQK